MTLQDPPRRSEAHTPGTTHNHGGMKDRWWVPWPPSFRGTFTVLLTHLSKIELCFSQKHTLIFCFLFLIHSCFDSFSSPVSPSCLLGWPRRKSPAPSCGLRLCSSQNRLHTDDSGPQGLLASSVQKECLSLPQSYQGTAACASKNHSTCSSEEMSQSLIPGRRGPAGWVLPSQGPVIALHSFHWH